MIEAALLIINALIGVAIVLACLRPGKPAPVSNAVIEQWEESIQQAYDTGYMAGYDDRDAGLDINPEILKRSGLIAPEHLNSYLSNQTEPLQQQML